jgi:hypothetical protein
MQGIGLPSGTVASHLHRGLAALRRELPGRYPAASCPGRYPAAACSACSCVWRRPTRGPRDVVSGGEPLGRGEKDRARNGSLPGFRSPASPRALPHPARQPRGQRAHAPPGRGSSTENRWPIRAATLTVSAHPGVSAENRSASASRVPGGTPRPPAFISQESCSIKNGLPPVRRRISAAIVAPGESPVTRATSCCTASTASPASGSTVLREATEDNGESSPGALTPSWPGGPICR